METLGTPLLVIGALTRLDRPEAHGVQPTLKGDAGLAGGAPVARYHNATTSPWPFPTFTGALPWRVLPRRSSGAAYRYQRRSTAEIGRGLKIMVSPVRFRVSPLLFCGNLQEKRREDDKPTMRALHNTERRELSEIKTRRAVEIGTSGAPSFVIGKERF